MKVYLVRHGQTNYNEARLCNADPSVDVHLTKTGIQQVNKLAKELKDTNFECIFISELLRTKQTAGAINKYHNVAVITDARLNDNRSGFEGKFVHDYYAALDAMPNKWEAHLNDGESIADVWQRVSDFVKDLKKQKYDAVLAVTSMIIIQLFYGVVKNMSYENLWAIKVERGSCSVIEI
jgi:broad specificity phosphatase PhoE